MAILVHTVGKGQNLNNFNSYMEVFTRPSPSHVIYSIIWVTWDLISDNPLNTSNNVLVY